MSLKGIAKETLRILEEGKYITDSGKNVEFLSEQRSAVAGTKLYKPEQAYELLAKENGNKVEKPLVIEVTDETTQMAAKRLVQTEGCDDVVLLNYASARNAGGGFINGAKAQEEDLCRCSGLYPCLLKQPLYYQANRSQDSLFYTDHVIYSPKVPWFRSQNRDLLDRVFLASVITAPAPNAGEVINHYEGGWTDIEKVLKRRAGIILALAHQHKHRTLLLGAWGCGVFRNRPNMVASAFGNWLEDTKFSGCFERVVFAIYDRSPEKTTLQAFQTQFPSN